ncbi:helix-turn-helix transcriptional regulator [Desulfonatronovibrio hydrogenovorans]|uniref:helix-turn-helix transcriptional regulator n=1 Tax=Desulfonatronovibrio hydrogenovorans TaxID=53245 RepID=UPI00048C2BFA|nr:WYL domain-containing protein [Desulfonatronovibrio hydrogenovorans]
MNQNFLERILWLHSQICRNAFPSPGGLARKFEISSRTAQRTVTSFRDRFQAPIEYDRTRKGYYYIEPGFELPFARFSQEEILTLILAWNLLEKSTGGYISSSIEDFSRKLIAGTSRMGLTRQKMEQSFSVVWNGHSPAQAQVFEDVSRALLDQKILCFSYTSPAMNQTTKRSVEPHHLQHYMGSWVLIAFCLGKKDWRKFYLSRMEEVQQQDKTFVPRPPDQWQYQVEESFGIFQGRENRPVILRFSRFRARWIREQIWHPDQKMRDLEDGSLELEIPVADFREIKLKVLSFGSDVEVVSPEELKQEVAFEIQKMARIYKK